jgi:outer membrane lipoprotein LolB
MRGFRDAGSPAIVRVAVAAQSLAAAALLAACVPASLERADTVVASPTARVVFEVAGRLSAHHGGDALTANFRWQHASERDELELASPFGQTIATLSGDPAHVRLQTADGRVSMAGDWTALTKEGLGWPLPVEGLSYWIQGSPHPGSPSTAEMGEGGRVAVLRQDGWTVVYHAYAPTAGDDLRPSRMTLSYPDVELRIAIDRWQ